MKTILLVDDDPLTIRMYEGKFRSLGVDVQTSTDGVECLQKLAVLKPDLILLDMLLPKIDGYTVLKKIRKDAKCSDVPVVVLSNLSPSEADVTKILALGVIKYFSKPDCKPAEVVGEVKRILFAKV